MFTVALIGPDGAGKSTIARRVVETMRLPSRYVYMGVNLESSNLVLPTTRLLLEIKRARGGRPDMAGPPDRSRAKALPRNPLRRLAVELKSALRLSNLAAEEWFRQCVVWSYQWRGNVVLFDRHFFSDYYAHDIVGTTPGRTLASRLHGLMLKLFYPRPALVICLDAPPEVLFARKGEGSLESLEVRRQEYLRMGDQFGRFEVVDATQSPDAVVREVTARIDAFATERNDSKSKAGTCRPARQPGHTET